MSTRHRNIVINDTTLNAAGSSMPIESDLHAWRVAALRGFSNIDGHEEALVALGVGQYLRIPIAADSVDAFRKQLGRRVWVDLDAWSVRLDEPVGRHA